MSQMRANNLLIRNIPDAVKARIDQHRAQTHQSQNEYILQALNHHTSSDTPLFDFASKAVQPSGNLPFTFIDLFAGIGGLRLGVQKAGGRCLFSSEWDRYSQKTYAAWYGETPQGDITKVPITQIPDHDLLVAGFPCQPFSIAGVSKKNSLGRAHGFKDATQGTLFFNVATIIEAKRPPAIMLENVKNLLSHDKGQTWKVILATLDELDYEVFHKIIDARDYVPQHRERVFIVGFDRRVFGKEVQFTFPNPPVGRKPILEDILEKNPDPKYTLSNHLWTYLQDYAARHKEKGNGFGFGLVGPESVTRTLSARYYKDGSEILISQGLGKNPRRLTVREAARLMGFDEDLKIVVSDTQAYKQFGNAVVPPVAAAVAKQIASTLDWQFTRTGMSLIKRRMAA